MPRETHEEDGMVWACPECDNAPVYRRERENVHYDTDSTFACHACGTGFEEPVERENCAPESGNSDLNGFSAEMREARDGESA